MFVDVTILDKQSLRIRGKNSSFVIDPGVEISKVAADAVLLLKDSKNDQGILRVTDYRVIIKGAGEYEVAGVRILVTKSDENFLYSLNVDNVGVLTARTSGLSKTQEAGDYNILILNVDCEFKETMVTGFSPSAVLLYGEKSEGALKMLGKKASKSQKFSMSADKLPAEMQVIILS
ncbi:MAG: hypothetical protein A3H50_03010 [Candidatus Levybacteria bacterium RIFCSPLOWO2_02_FULL_37_10]|nr:MAG: hypothetical protein A2860_02575 [Candidatus Levybacteria bacterium RIFCSPHIGHO2_01_FULL_37_33]OGH15596.1 MAG: hypothetical protein A3C97_01255 [Candidatus Levybacteria bacterium RIFCSPHIGHO2_02_FULL_37_11]OGH29696.1 MAG: hypothetical protein A3F30_02960 [Candidatus Levybacteria bacterium RIFCSPHIGHO2_12_FULL_37_12]OGH45795.1 MAG: hypothetical protein A3H50_03010 [Candidatus Levybacteria bacterium RIFCSPLOWO2_02_FULL_37_10]